MACMGGSTTEARAQDRGCCRRSRADGVMQPPVAGCPPPPGQAPRRKPSGGLPRPPGAVGDGAMCTLRAQVPPLADRPAPWRPRARVPRSRVLRCGFKRHTSHTPSRCAVQSPSRACCAAAEPLRVSQPSNRTATARRGTPMQQTAVCCSPVRVRWLRIADNPASLCPRLLCSASGRANEPHARPKATLATDRRLPQPCLCALQRVRRRPRLSPL